MPDKPDTKIRRAWMIGDVQIDNVTEHEYIQLCEAIRKAGITECFSRPSKFVFALAENEELKRYIKVDCPKCEMPAGQLCLDGDYALLGSVHIARAVAAIKNG
jgi:hypothetical protein